VLQILHISGLLEYMNSVDHREAEKLETSRITMKNIIGNFHDKNFKHIISVMKI
ncbi:278_t:CDS:1, partial [Entrophospora sp. SA101]